MTQTSSKLAICSVGLVIFCIVLATYIGPVYTQDTEVASDSETTEDPGSTPPAGGVSAAPPGPVNQPQSPGEGAPAAPPGPVNQLPPGEGAGAQKADEALFQGEWRSNYDGHGTTHEKLGQPHFPFAEFTPFSSKTNYTKEPSRSTVAMDPVFNLTHLIFDNLFGKDIPPGYLQIINRDTLVLGPKVEQNDWRDLLAEYWLLLLWVIILLILIIVMPFIAVCYCCFCCCRRCKQGCPPCDSTKDARKRFCCGLLLLLLIIGILFGVIIAFVTNKMLDNGFDDTSATMMRGSEDACTYLRDVSDHIHHLFVNNYEEMSTHLDGILKEAHSHIFLDIMDTSGANALEELERILDNMEDARKLMREIDKLEKDLRLYGAQLRDGLRGVKRDVNYACAVLCGNRECLQFLQKSEIEFLDSSKCLHFDHIPNSNIYTKAIEDIIASQAVIIPKNSMERLQEIGHLIQEALDRIVPVLTSDIGKGKELFREAADNIRNIISAVLSDVHLNTLKSTKSFEDVYEKFGSNRSAINVFVCVVLSVILVLLVVALICGCCGRRRRGYRDDCCSKGTGATCLLVAILLIFCVFSLVVLVGLFYFVFGLVTYQGACAPLRDQENNSIFRQLNAEIDLNKFLPQKEMRAGGSQLPSLRMSDAIRTCKADESIFKLLHENKIYDIDDLTRINVINNEGHPEDGLFKANFSKMDVLTPDEATAIEKLLESNLSNYHSSKYTEHMCNTLTTVDLITMSSQLNNLRDDLWSQWGIYDFARTSLQNEAFNLQKLQTEFVNKIKNIMDKMTEKLLRLDDLILYLRRPFNQSITDLLYSTKRSDKFIKSLGVEYVNVLCDNLTLFMEEQVEKYVNRVVDESKNNVGKCAPLAYIYYRGVDLICHRLVDPMNGFWVGVLLCALLFLPVLFVAHRLLCLYKMIDPFAAPVAGIVEGGGDYLYDAYSEREREHVPLANVPKKRRKAYERRREQQDYYEDTSPGVSRASRGGGGDAAAGTSNMRYNDVAPTHWDHEPPRYHNPPVAPPSSEYERPPPYYYPGASDQD